MPGFEIFGEEEKKHIQDVMDSGILMRYNFDSARNNHWKAKEFETQIQEKLNSKYVHLTSSGTTALIAAIKALGIGIGDEIILPSFTFVASFEAVLFCGAIPIIADIDETLTLDPKSVENAISPRTKAIMPVHMCGAMADLEPLQKIAKKYSLFLIEDACQAIGGKYKNAYLGTIGDIGCFSFDFVKTITCGEGGAVLTENEKYYNFTHAFSDHGHDHLGNDRGAENHTIIGLNFRISELHAAIGLAQWQKLDEIIQKQNSFKNQLKSILLNNPKIEFRRIPDPNGDNGSFLSLILENETIARTLANELKANGIPSAYWYDNNWHYVRKWDHFKNLKWDKTIAKEQRDALPDYLNQDFSASDEIIKRVITLPISLNFTDERIQEIGQFILNQLNKTYN